jgi:hypothetical protein
MEEMCHETMVYCLHVFAAYGQPSSKKSNGSIQKQMRLLFLTFGVVPEHLVPIIPSIRRHAWGFFQLDAGSRLQWNLAPEL